MVGYRDGSRSSDAFRDLVLVVDAGLYADLDEIDRLVQELRSELKDLELESVVQVSSAETPLGAKGASFVDVGALLVTLSAAGGVFPLLMEVARDWLARHASAHRISVTIDGDTIELARSSAQERKALIKAFMSRHELE